MTGLPPEPDWLAAWREAGLAPEAALARWDGLAAVEPGAMLGVWRGVGLATGHPLDHLLEALGWFGKAFEAEDRVHPLLFRRARRAPLPVEPALMPTGLALRLPGLAGSAAVRQAFAAALPALRARRFGAYLERRRHRGRESAAMVYRAQPIVDHFRAAGSGRVVGLMERRGMERPFFFLLERDAAEA